MKCNFSCFYNFSPWNEIEVLVKEFRSNFDELLADIS